jgi:hypothetical protein
MKEFITESRGPILGRNPDKSFKIFLLAIHSHLNSFALRFCFFKLTQPLTVSTVHLLYTVKEKGEKPDRKPYFFPYGLRIHTETSSLRTLKIMPSTKLYVHEFGFRIHTMSEKKNKIFTMTLSKNIKLITVLEIYSCNPQSI